MSNTNAQLRAISKWNDDANTDRDPTAQTWNRVAKISEESGEAIAAYLGVTGQNPRKGVTHTLLDVQEELLDVAITALCAIIHLHANHDIDVLALLSDKTQRVALRALGPIAMTALDGDDGEQARESAETGLGTPQPPSGHQTAQDDLNGPQNGIQALREAAQDWSEFEVYDAADGHKSIRRHGLDPAEWLDARADRIEREAREAREARQ